MHFRIPTVLNYTTPGFELNAHVNSTMPIAVQARLIALAGWPLKHSGAYVQFDLYGKKCDNVS